MAERVNAAAERLGYRPNGLAQALRGGRLGVVGLLIPDVSNPWFARLARAAEDACRERGLGVILCNSDNRPEQEQACLELMWERRVDGLLLASVRGEAPRGLAHHVSRNWPVVAFDESCRGPGIDLVVSDNRQGGRLIAEHLVNDCGCERIAIIGGPERLQTAEHRREGLIHAIEKHGRSVVTQVPGDFTFAGGARAMASLIESGVRFDALVALNDMMAIGALQQCLRAGRHIPDDFVLAGFDDIEIAAWTGVGLTTVRQDVDGLAAAAVELVNRRLDDPHCPVRHDVLETALVVRESSGSGHRASQFSNTG